MLQNYEIGNMLKNLPFYREEIKSLKKKNKKFSNDRVLSELTNYQLSKKLPFFPKRSKRSKRFKRPRRLTKHRILKNLLPYYETVGISRKQHAFRSYAEIYGVEVVDKTSLSDSLFLAKSSIIELFSDLLRKKDVLNTFYQ